ncbi:hypothetical protein ABVS_2766 [Acinetobacter lwoffii]|uniref:hypothetical protein n=1 Tax=Acinetobacter lwoffii TaxID=28090 RepID=UPI001C92DE26|nr:hypothetical protein [Acinetobacter lwoffii]QZM13393.1 hypothetical protein ABVS_2766 [Acinetobacter lwoffii]
MKTITFTTLLLSLAVTGCQNTQPTEQELDEATIALEKSEKVLGTYVDRLESEFTTQDVRTKILCKDYPHEYKTNYVPNMLTLSSEYTEAVLLSDLDRVLKHYKQQDQIQC